MVIINGLIACVKKRPLEVAILMLDRMTLRYDNIFSIKLVLLVSLITYFRWNGDNISSHRINWQVNSNFSSQRRGFDARRHHKNVSVVNSPVATFDITDYFPRGEQSRLSPLYGILKLKA